MAKYSAPHEEPQRDVRDLDGVWVERIATNSSGGVRVRWYCGGRVSTVLTHDDDGRGFLCCAEWRTCGHSKSMYRCAHQGEKEAEACEARSGIWDD